ncbi:MAG: hypothetical protein U9Q73_00335 [Nanoarchaeota archaeon]|nr:hypothetical protein [Nanoarchaeota archaeon]
MTYCDTNIITSSINRIRLKKSLGGFGCKKFEDSIKSESPFGEKELREIKKCVVSRDPLLSDIGRHKHSLGAVLSLSSIKKLDIKKVNGLKKGREIYNKACSKVDKKSRFYKGFCKRGKLKSNRELNHNNLNDIKHFGSAIELGEKEFITINKQDFKPLKNVTNIKIK